MPHALSMESVVIYLALTLHRKMENLMGIYDHIPTARVSLGPLGLMVSMMVLGLIFVLPPFQERLYRGLT